MNIVEGSGSKPFDPAQILATLNRHKVQYVVIGGFGALLHGAPVPPTKDLDVTPASDRENLSRLAAALKELEATLRAPGLIDGVSILLDDKTFERMTTMTFFTKAGAFDASLRPDGTEGYPDLVRGAVLVEFKGESTPVAALEDIIRSKTAAGRTKDLNVLADLRTYAASHPAGGLPHYRA